MNQQTSLQMLYAPNSICFGCGPANENGLKVGSIPIDEKTTVAYFKPKSFHQAFPGVLNGGIIGSLLDCHSNWTAAWWLMKKNNLRHPPCTVTAEYYVKLLRPTPVDEELCIYANVVEEESKDDRAVVEARIESNGKVSATCRGVFVAVKPGHPAYHRW